MEKLDLTFSLFQGSLGLPMMESVVVPFVSNFTMMNNEFIADPINNLILDMSFTSLEKNSSNYTTFISSFNGCPEEDNPSVFCYHLPSSKWEQVSDSEPCLKIKKNICKMLKPWEYRPEFLPSLVVYSIAFTVGVGSIF